DSACGPSAASPSVCWVLRSAFTGHSASRPSCCWRFCSPCIAAWRRVVEAVEHKVSHGMLTPPALQRQLGSPAQNTTSVDEAEGVVEHQPLHLAAGGAAPVAAGEKGPADLDFPVQHTRLVLNRTLRGWSTGCGRIRRRFSTNSSPAST